MTLDPVSRYKFRKQRSRELDRRSSGTPDNDVLDRSTVVVQVLLLRKVEPKFKLLHVAAPKRWG